MTYINPFKPTAGAEPPRIIGRDAAVMAFIQGLENGVGAPGSLMRITGPRGSGKTVLLNDLGDKARERSWCVVDVTAGVSLMDDLLYGLTPSVSLDSVNLSASLGVVSGSVTASTGSANLRALMKTASSSANGLLITIDEVQDAAQEDMQRIAQAVQHLIREKENIALVFAGLPMGVMDLINGKAMTFLRRAMSEELLPINMVEVALSLGDSFRQTGLLLSDDAQAAAAKATGGYAFMIQLVGYYIWQRADLHREKSTTVSQEDIDQGIAIAREQFHQLVLETAISGISKGAMEYLIAMSCDEGMSSTASVAQRMGRSPKLAGSLRHQLIQKQIIQAPARGYVEFAIPFLRDYIAQNKHDLMLRYGG